jgi:hypothetical protein
LERFNVDGQWAAGVAVLSTCNNPDPFLLAVGSSSFGDNIVAFDDKEEARAAVAGLETVSIHKHVGGWDGQKKSVVVPGQKLCVRRVSVKFEVIELEDPDDFESIDLCESSAIVATAKTF